MGQIHVALFRFCYLNCTCIHTTGGNKAVLRHLVSLRNARSMVYVGSSELEIIWNILDTHSWSALTTIVILTADLVAGASINDTGAGSPRMWSERGVSTLLCRSVWGMHVKRTASLMRNRKPCPVQRRYFCRSRVYQQSWLTTLC
jgi:hypothetical protein